MASRPKSVAYVFLFIPQKFKIDKIINQATGGRKAPCCCLICLIEQRLIGLGAEKWLKIKILQGIRCMFMGRQVYVYGEILDLR